MVLSFHLILEILGVVREPHLPPCVADCLHGDVVLRVDDPLGHIMAHGSRNRNIGILQHYPRMQTLPLRSDYLLKQDTVRAPPQNL